MKITRYFTQEGRSPYADIPFRAARPSPAAAKAAQFSAADILYVPAAFSQTAIDTLAQTACARGVPAKLKKITESAVPEWLWRATADEEALARLSAAERCRRETDAGEIFDRMSGAWTYSGWKNGYFAAEKDARAFYDELRYMLAGQYAAPNAAQWQNAGLYWAYGIEPAAADAFNPPAAETAITVLDINHPDIEAYIRAGIQAADEKEALQAGRALLKKHAEAILRACRAPLPSADKAVFDPLANAQLKSAVAAARHDGVADNSIQRFIQTARQGWERMLRGDENADADRPAPGAVLRRAVALPHNFLRAVEKDEDWQLLPSPADGFAPQKLCKARALWDKIAYAVWAGRAPELHFHTTIHEGHTAPAAGAIHASSADSAFLFADEASGAAVLLNLSAFAEDKNNFNYAAFIHAVRLWVIVSDILPFTAQFPSAAAARQTQNYRPIALGYANFAALLMAMGVAYDSEQGRAFCAAITALMTGAAYIASAELAAKLGAFSAYAANAQSMLRTVRNRCRAAYGQINGYEKLSISPVPLKAAHCPNGELPGLARAAWDKALRMGETYGFRNAQLTALSAEPAAAALLDCDTPGLAAEKALVKFKKRADGSCFKIISRAVSQALFSLGYEAEQIADISAYLVGSADLNQAPIINSAALRDKGFDENALQRLQAALPNASSLRAVFSAAVLGEDFCRDILGFSAAELRQPDFDMLGALGFAPENIAQAELFLCGAGQIQGAPHLRAEHYAVFACADASSDNAEREKTAADCALSWASQIRMTAAAQAFLCGGLSGQLVLPAQAAAEDCAKAAMLAWKLGLKTLNISRRSDTLPHSLIAALKAEAEPGIAPKQKEEQNSTANAHADVLPKAEREKLPNRRQGYTQKAIIGGHKIYLHTGEFADGRLGEIFVDMGKEGAAFRAVMHNFATAVSIGLQYGVPLESFVDAFIATKFEPAGLVHGNETIKKASSILDYIFRELAVSYLNRHDLAHAEITDASVTALDIDRAQTERQLIPAGWKYGAGLKSNITAAYLPAAKDEESAVKTDIGGQAEDETNGDCAPINMLFSQFSKNSAESGFAAESRAEAAFPAAAIIKEEKIPAETASARLSAKAPSFSAEGPFTPFSNPAYFIERPANIAEKQTEKSLEEELERSLIDELFGNSAPEDSHKTEPEKTPIIKIGEPILRPASRSQPAAQAKLAAETTAPQPDNARSQEQDTGSGSALYRARPINRIMQGYTRDICPECGNHTMLRSGAVLKCDICGASLTPKGNSAP